MHLWTVCEMYKVSNFEETRYFPNKANLEVEWLLRGSWREESDKDCRTGYSSSTVQYIGLQYASTTFSSNSQYILFTYMYSIKRECKVLMHYFYSCNWLCGKLCHRITEWNRWPYCKVETKSYETVSDYIPW